MELYGATISSSSSTIISTRSWSNNNNNNVNDDKKDCLIAMLTPHSFNINHRNVILYWNVVQELWNLFKKKEEKNISINSMLLVMCVGVDSVYSVDFRSKLRLFRNQDCHFCLIFIWKKMERKIQCERKCSACVLQFSWWRYYFYLSQFSLLNFTTLDLLEILTLNVCLT